MFEDDNLSYKVTEESRRIAIAEDNVVNHFQKASFKTLGEAKELELFNQNKSYFEEKWNTTWQLHTLRAGIPLNSNSRSTELSDFLED